jgi:hypothetical protein
MRTKRLPQTSPTRIQQCVLTLSSLPASHTGRALAMLPFTANIRSLQWTKRPVDSFSPPQVPLSHPVSVIQPRFLNHISFIYHRPGAQLITHCATNLKMAGSIPDGVIGTIHWRNPTGCTVALGLTLPLPEISTGNISWGREVKTAAAWSWKPYNIQVPTVLKHGSLKFLEFSGSV